MSAFVGLISGTSADAVDAALVQFDDGKPRLLKALGLPIPPALRQRILELYNPGTNEIDRLGELDRELGNLFGEAALTLIARAGLQPEQVTAIGSHGQTVRHRPDAALPFTLQIGDANTIAELTGITTVTDFRRRDMACGGEGAPLTPGLHSAVFASSQADRAILNIGGIANVTVLLRNSVTLGLDIGPGNGLMDSWTERHLGLPYDKDGAWAATGKVNGDLLHKLLQHPFFARSAPKSTGREEFTLSWVDEVLQGFPSVAPQHVQATLLQLTASSIAQSIMSACPSGTEIYVCGGGAHNTFLCQQLQTALPGYPLASTARLGIDPDWVEAIAFAWLAMRTLNNLPGNLKAVTGAARNVILGGIYPGRQALAAGAKND